MPECVHEFLDVVPGKLRGDVAGGEHGFDPGAQDGVGVPGQGQVWGDEELPQEEHDKLAAVRRVSRFHAGQCVAQERHCGAGTSGRRRLGDDSLKINTNISV